MALIAARAEAESRVPAAGPSRPSCPALLENVTAPPGSPGEIEDVALDPGGTVYGRVFWRGQRAYRTTAPGLPVALVQGTQTIATTVTEAGGRFRFGDLRGGLYRVVIRTGDGPVCRWYRLWTPRARPPHATEHASVLLDRTLVRGQLPGPFKRLPPAAMVGAIAVGAIMPPIIYHSVKRDDYIPASP